MKVKDIIILIIMLVIISFGSGYVVTNLEAPVLWLIILIIPSIFIFNFVVRKKPEFKPYFTSRINVLTSKYAASISSELPKELMYHKMLEVIETSPLKLAHANTSTLEILSTKGMGWTSWGENIYVDFTEEKGTTTMNFVSTTVLGIISWGRNEKNYNRLLSNFEESLTI